MNAASMQLHEYKCDCNHVRCGGIHSFSCSGFISKVRSCVGTKVTRQIKVKFIVSNNTETEDPAVYFSLFVACSVQIELYLEQEVNRKQKC